MRVDEDAKLRERLKEEVGQPFVDIKTGFKIGQEESYVWYRILPENTSKLRLNQAVLIYDLMKDIWFGGTIDVLEMRQPTELDRDTSLYQSSGKTIVEQITDIGAAPLHQNPFLARVSLFCMYENGTKKTATTCPGSASVLLLPTTETKISDEPVITNLVGLRTEGIIVGVYSQDQLAYSVAPEKFLLYYLDLQRIQNRHILALGGSGSGKTEFLKHLIKQLLTHSYGILAFDTQADILQILFEPSKEQKEVEFKKENHLHEKIHKQIDDTTALPSNTQIHVYFPVTSSLSEEAETKRTSISEICRLRNFEFREFSLQFANVSSTEEIEPFMHMSSAQAADLLQELLRLDEKVSLEEFVNRFQSRIDNGQRLGNEMLLEGFTIPYWNTTISSLRRGLNALRNRGIYDVARQEPANYAPAGQLSIVFLEHLPEGDRRIYVQHIVQRIYESRTQVALPGIYLVIDEAHEIVPKKSPPGVTEDYAARLAATFSKIAREGRKNNINLLISTHKPRDIHEVVYDLCGTKIVFRIARDDAIAIGLADVHKNIVQGLNPGYALVDSPENHPFAAWLELKVPLPNVLHESPSRFLNDTLPALIGELKKQAMPREVVEKRKVMKGLG